MRGDKYQIALIGLGVVTTLLFGVFFYRELFPEYKMYQQKFAELENIRSEFIKQPTPIFSYGVKQLVFEREDKGPAKVERCISCHVALKIEDYSPTKIALNEEGKPLFDEKGFPKKVINENYIWRHLDQQIEGLRKAGNDSKADKLAELKIARVQDYIYDVTKVLQAHPLIGKETRPFENHPMDDYGCVSCHNGNGQGLVTDRAHGPVFDESYEIEEEGFQPQFLEKDEKNDPLFAKVFNDKPGHRLLFQVNPLYVGALVQAKCVECHNPEHTKENLKTDGNLSLTSSPSKTISKDFLKNYHRGKELYIAEACYACHRISGFTRGGVGPELTQEGDRYPWFIKQSLVWPQADLKTSTMPNYRLDHEELQDLMTFILAQKGKTRFESAIDYKTRLTKWDAGDKMPWEKPISAKDVLDVNYGLTVFATEGCAACHRLKGFESNVAYKDAKNPESKLKDSQWFQSLFHEQILGSTLAETLETQGQEIDRRIIKTDKENLILETLEKDYPGLVSSFYASFKFASRKSQDPVYQERLHKVLMMFVQEYGLGRQIGPKPDWSGVFRSEKWLMEHFRNPQASVPRSIMPIFPFDETKFYALTNMLQVIAKQNVKNLKSRWDLTGFRPDVAYKMLCAQCHGDNLEGNGPIAEWIYPIPKSLKKADFLRNLTKSRVRDSISHGIVGTPMPPWNEVQNKDQRPVLTTEEIENLTNWIFSFVSGSEVIRESKDVPKWQYTPEKVIEDLQNEGGILESGPKLSSYFKKVQGRVAALKQSQTHEPALVVQDIFNKVENPQKTSDPYLYYIKKEYYTPENIEAGQSFFWLNCATCHGKEADGTGLRAEAMFDAKPRMLINLHWVDSKDDLALLRSIKYGVPGTSMTPWGDLTSSKQRLQLVIFIRSLSESANLRASLNDALWSTFEAQDIALEKAAYEPSEKLILGKENYKNLEITAEKSPTVENIKAQLDAKKELQAVDAYVQNYQKLRDLFKSEKEIYLSLGQQILVMKDSASILEIYKKLISVNQNILSFGGGEIKINRPEAVSKNERENVNQLLKVIDDRASATLALKQLELAKDEKTRNTETIKNLDLQLKSLEKVKALFISDFAKIKNLREKETQLVNDLKKAKE